MLQHKLRQLNGEQIKNRKLLSLWCKTVLLMENALNVCRCFAVHRDAEKFSLNLQDLFNVRTKLVNWKCLLCTWSALANLCKFVCSWWFDVLMIGKWDAKWAYIILSGGIHSLLLCIFNIWTVHMESRKCPLQYC